MDIPSGADAASEGMSPAYSDMMATPPEGVVC